MDWLNPVNAWIGLQEFLETGGDVLLIIMASTFVMWALILERLAYWGWAHPKEVDDVLAAWQARGEHKSWHAHAVRERLISEVRQSAERNVEFIKTLVAIAPLLGLMGTVTGMVQVFDVMAISGSSNARAMSAGVSKATIPTMAGMVSALSGLFFAAELERRAKKQVQLLGDHLETD
ncbi:MAG: MotA/TolQ/ExbB proton channel family protein [Caulobacterales bacterium]|nr:MotA/TolQ/ExbB proton channel family protein [Caulobacterales bacterium]